jgi:hypothetical protein
MQIYWHNACTGFCCPQHEYLYIESSGYMMGGHQ